MALIRRSGRRFTSSIWTGFVDAMTALLLVLVFVLTIFMIVQFVLSEKLSRQGDQLNRLAQEIEFKDDERKELDKEIADKNARLIALNSKIVGQSSVIESLNERISFDEGRIGSLNDQIGNRDDQIAALNAEVSNRELMILDLNNQIALNENKINTLSEELDERNKKIDVLTLNVASKEGEIKNLTGRVFADEDRIRSLERQIAEKDSDILELVGNIASKDGIIQTLDSQITVSEIEIAELRLEIADWRAKNDNLATELASERSKVLDLDTTLSSTSSDLLAANRRLAELTESVNALQQTAALVPVQELRILELSENVADKERELGELNRLVGRQETEFDELQARFNGIVILLDQERDRAAGLENTVERQSIELAVLGEQNLGLNKTLSDTESQNSELADLIAKLRQESDSMSSRNAELETSISGLKLETDDLTAQLIVIQDENGKLITDINALRLELARAAETNIARSDQISANESEIEELNELVVRQRNESEELRASLAELADSLGLERERLAQMERDADERDLLLATFVEENAELTDMLAGFGGEGADVRDRIAVLISEFTTLTSRNEELAAQSAANQRSLNDQTLLLATLQEERERLEKLLADFGGENSEVFGRVSALMSEYVKASAKNAELSEESFDNQRSMDEQSRLLTTLKEERERIIEMLAGYTLPDSSLADRIAAVLRDSDTLLASNRRLRNELSEALRYAEVNENDKSTIDRLEQALDKAELDKLANERTLAEVQRELDAAIRARNALNLAIDENRKKIEEALTLLASTELAKRELERLLETTESELESANLKFADQAAELAAAKSAIQASDSERGLLEDKVREQIAIAEQLGKALSKAEDSLKSAESEAANERAEASSRQNLLDTANELILERNAQLLENQTELRRLNRQIDELRGQLAVLQGSLEVAEEKDRQAQVQISSLGSRLNQALARAATENKRRLELEQSENERLKKEAQDLARFRSDFLSALRDVFEGREGVRIVGDRFVFSSEVLFATSEIELSPDGKSEIESVAKELIDVAKSFPKDIDWVLRIDGHTDDVPVREDGIYDDNWELSQARSLSVVRYLVDALGFEPHRLMATGFGEFRPVSPGKSDEARSRNRRIEFKLTEP